MTRNELTALTARLDALIDEVIEIRDSLADAALPSMERQCDKEKRTSTDHTNTANAGDSSSWGQLASKEWSLLRQKERRLKRATRSLSERK